MAAQTATQTRAYFCADRINDPSTRTRTTIRRRARNNTFLSQFTRLLCFSRRPNCLCAHTQVSRLNAHCADFDESPTIQHYRIFSFLSSHSFRLCALGDNACFRFCHTTHIHRCCGVWGLGVHNIPSAVRCTCVQWRAIEEFEMPPRSGSRSAGVQNVLASILCKYALDIRTCRHANSRGGHRLHRGNFSFEFEGW